MPMPKSMRQTTRLLSALALAALASFGTSAQAYVLDFGNGPNAPALCTSAADGSGPLITCGNGSNFSQSYGDVAGVVDVIYNAPRINATQTLQWWSTSYNDLYGVLWATGGDANSLARIDLVPTAGQFVTLNSFELGAWVNTTRATNIAISDLATGALLFSFTGDVGSATAGATLFTPNAVSTGGLRIEWRDSAFNVGIDNVSFDVSPIPETGTWALMAAGLAVVGAAARRRKA